MDKIVWTQTLQLDDSVNVYFIQKTILTNSSIKQQKKEVQYENCSMKA